MTVQQVMRALEAKGSAACRSTFERHGAPQKMFGVRVGDLKTILKKTKGDHALALELWDTGNADAMYLAGLMADPAQMTKRDLDHWARTASWFMLAEYSVAGVAAESAHGEALAAKWIDARKELVADAGWATWGGLVALRPDDELDLRKLRSLLGRVEKTVHKEQNRVRYTMNGFVISVGCYVGPLHERALSAAEKIGKVDVDQGDTACKVPLATEYIAKVTKAGKLGRKRKTVRC